MTQHLDHGHLHLVPCFLLAVLKLGIMSLSVEEISNP